MLVQMYRCDVQNQSVTTELSISDVEALIFYLHVFFKKTDKQIKVKLLYLKYLLNKMERRSECHALYIETDNKLDADAVQQRSNSSSSATSLAPARLHKTKTVTTFVVVVSARKQAQKPTKKPGCLEMYLRTVPTSRHVGLRRGEAIVYVQRFTRNKVENCVLHSLYSKSYTVGHLEPMSAAGVFYGIVMVRITVECVLEKMSKIIDFFLLEAYC